MGAQTVVADVADELARRVVAGDYEAGDLMPSVRQVAEEFEMNRATAQLVLGRLESYGFAQAYRGKGFVIRDVRADGGAEVYRRVFQLSLGTPEVAAEMFRDIVAEERGIVLDALVAYTDGAERLHPGELTAAVDELETLARTPEPDHRAMLALELDLVRRLLTVLDHGMRRAVLNSIGETVLDVPEAVAAYYAAGPDLHVLVWRALLAVWESDGGPSAAQLALFEDLFEMYHAKVVARFAELVGASGEPEARRSARTA
ncbi:GntR family transcriptional regulator [Nocardia otitidiscaviarum]|uniref:GntR family transcriptional regulator n=1 Tax=Nocardia otitidiscaviarum TaxID=1823 RepID=A0A516NFB1_9NOCA|nr:GntR family transcriptional regulator [Nocardia otitidiscaviarum]MBF6178452.1 GntR family transcriptional regulator [Nocardia otitidiscaviarum]MBF6240201.1 GntR family transcriptional regulator [Nocardia otitidiscaviarum]MCP9622907.1 GntR family transcriptional regulator [Nocardia otitidiscaviarum]QDP77592.1 GntR family transcriptional regulator [Nocardia otitidiscaviarum]